MSFSTLIPAPHANRPRTYLFLRGHPSGLWPRLADALAARGDRVLRVNLSLADRVFWGRRTGLSYKGDLDGWSPWLDALIQREGVTDIICHAGRDPYHLVAHAVARRHGARCWDLEFGYFRPDWLTFETDGVNAFSSFPRTPGAIRQLANSADAPDFQPCFAHRLWVEHIYETLFHLLERVGHPAYPEFRSDRTHRLREQILPSLREVLIAPAQRVRAHGLPARLSEARARYNIFALQLQSDYQVRHSGGLCDPDALLDHVFESFARHAPPDRRLVLKRHPMDTGVENWPRRVRRAAHAHGLADRVHLIKGGPLTTLLQRSEGAVMVNSTTGIHALRLHVPVCVLGPAIYDVDGLTHRNGLDAFWCDPAPVDVDLVQAFLRALSARQVRGSFHGRTGQAAAIGSLTAMLDAAASIALPTHQTFSTLADPATPDRVA